METPHLPSHDDVSSQIASLELGVDASELHGSLCGFLAGGGEATRSDWLKRLEVDPDSTAPAADSALDGLYLASRAQLGDPDLGFALLLPEDAAAVDERAEALLAWCRGFLGGFGLVQGSTDALSPEAREALEDMGKIAASNLSYDEPDADEAALMEVTEFVRVATLLLYGDNTAVSPESRRLH